MKAWPPIATTTVGAFGPPAGSWLVVIASEVASLDAQCNQAGVRIAFGAEDQLVAGDVRLERMRCAVLLDEHQVLRIDAKGARGLALAALRPGRGFPGLRRVVDRDEERIAVLGEGHLVVLLLEDHSLPGASDPGRLPEGERRQQEHQSDRGDPNCVADPAHD